MRLRNILGEKGGSVVTIPPDRTVLEAVRLLVERNIGSVIVVADGEMRGILTERDVLRLTASQPGDLADLSISAVMTTDVVTAAPGDPLQRAMQLMTENRIRHLPIISDGELVGILSIGDLVNALRESVQDENHQLRRYIQGTVY